MITHVCMFKLQQENHKEILDKAVKLAESLYTIPNAVKGEVVVNDTLADSSNYDLCLLFGKECYHITICTVVFFKKSDNSIGCFYSHRYRSFLPCSSEHQYRVCNRLGTYIIAAACNAV